MFGLCQIHAFVDYVRSKLTKEQFETLFKSLVLLTGVVSLAAAGVATATGSILFDIQEIVFDCKSEIEQLIVNPEKL